MSARVSPSTPAGTFDVTKKFSVSPDRGYCAEAKLGTTLYTVKVVQDTHVWVVMDANWDRGNIALEINDANALVAVVADLLQSRQLYPECPIDWTNAPKRLEVSTYLKSVLRNKGSQKFDLEINGNRHAIDCRYVSFEDGDKIIEDHTRHINDNDEVHLIGYREMQQCVSYRGMNRQYDEYVAKSF
jgi:hypothetical protein